MGCAPGPALARSDAGPRPGSRTCSRPGPAADSVVEAAADARALLDHLGIDRAHVVGHSYGGCVALQLALDAPRMVRSLALVEAALLVGPKAGAYRDALKRNARSSCCRGTAC